MRIPATTFLTVIVQGRSHTLNVGFVFQIVHAVTLPPDPLQVKFHFFRISDGVRCVTVKLDEAQIPVTIVLTKISRKDRPPL